MINQTIVDLLFIKCAYCISIGFIIAGCLADNDF